MDMYSHVTAQMHEDAAAKIDAAIRLKGTGAQIRVMGKSGPI
jgi:hypothetical protein